MHKAEPLIIHKCIVCGKAWTKIQSLRAHMRVHHRQGYVRSSIFIQKQDWDDFKDVCQKHNTTTCHLMGARISAALAGEKQGVITVGSPNPTIINVNHYFSGTPRSMYKAPMAPPSVPGSGCPTCGSSNVETRKPTLSQLVEGHCRSCRAEWLISPPQKSRAPRDGGDSP